MLELAEPKTLPSTALRREMYVGENEPCLIQLFCAYFWCFDALFSFLQYTGMTNLDTGDAKGDVFFGIYELSIPELCKSQSARHLPQVLQ